MCIVFKQKWYSNKSLPREKRINVELFEKIVNKRNILLQHFFLEFFNFENTFNFVFVELFIKIV